MLVGISGKLFHQILLAQVVGQLFEGFILGKFLPVVVRIVVGELQDKPTHGCLFEVRGKSDCVFGHEDVGRNAATAVH